MRITGKIQQEFTIDEREQNRIAFDYIYKKMDWDSLYYIEDNVVYRTVDYHVNLNIKVRDATEIDHKVYEFIQIVRQKIYEEYRNKNT